MNWLIFMWIILLVLALAADLCGIYLLIKIAKAKGHCTDGAGALWFIGLCGTLFMLGFIVAALPDWSDRPNAAPTPGSSDPNGLPEV